MAALAVLWGCETLTEESDKPLLKNDMPVGNFFRSAAIFSQDKFDYQSAAKYYRNLYTRDPNDMAALLGLVRNLRYIGSAAQSVALLEEAMPENPGVFAVRAEYGKALVAAGRAMAAVDVLVELLEEIPDDWEILSALGIAYDLLDEPGKAERAYRAALEITPRNANVINNLALSLALSGRIDDGIALLKEAVDSTSSTPHIRQNLALMYAMKGDMKSARRLAERDLPREMVENNLKYYERLFSGNNSAQLNGAQSSGAQPSGAVEVSRLEAPAREAVLPGSVQESQDTATVAAVQEADEIGQPDQTALPPIEGIKIQLGVFKTLDRANARLTAMRDGNVDLLSGLRFVIDEVEGIDTPVGYMVMAGPMASREVAADLCTKLHSRKEVCRLILP